MKLVIVESPAKAKTINKYLGPDYKVLASYGHVRDLPAKDGSVRPDEDFAMDWEVGARSKPRLADITKTAAGADRIILATDPDREGEAISWHVRQVLADKRATRSKPVERVVFNAITKRSVLEAMEQPRDIDQPLVEAYLARRALDYLVGFTLSPVLWRKLPGARSAGRVQSVALRLVCERENEIERFKPQEYWSVLAQLTNAAGALFEARLSEYDGRKMDRLAVENEEQANAIRRRLMTSSLAVRSVEAKPVRRNPYAPFTTSTLQQDASSKLGFSASRTMQVAQRLYEGVDIGGETVGLITYMRTDGVQMAPEAIEETRAAIKGRYGQIFLPDKPRVYASKAKNAQEAHEAIRPTSLDREPREVARYLDEDQRRLYDLIWRRTMASQMAAAVVERTTADIEASHKDGTAVLRATGSVVTFEGYLKVYEEKKKDDDEDKRLVPLKQGEKVGRESIDIAQHFTEPPPRYSEASLIKRMEELGIGRPSTYAATLKTLEDREYVTIDKRRLLPQAKGRVVTSFLESFFERYVEYDFTAGLEEKLDRISAGDLQWTEVLREFWREFSAHVEETKDLRITEVLDHLNDSLGTLAFPSKEDGTDPRLCPRCGEGQLSLKISNRNGAFIGCSNYPDCKYSRDLGVSAEQAETDAALNEPKVLGVDPDTSQEVTLRNGRFGPYVQLGEDKGSKRTSVPKEWDAASMDMERAMRLLSLPRHVGDHPETGKPIHARPGRFGPVLEHDGKFAGLAAFEEIFEVGINRAVDLLAEAATGGGRGARGGTNLQELGEHPELGGPVTVKDGRYGPYVNHGKVNATIPGDRDPKTIGMAEAVDLLRARAEKMGTKPAKRSTKAKSSAKKPAAKKKAAPKKATAAKPKRSSKESA